jgi:hypothetical protein
MSLTDALQVSLATFLAQLSSNVLALNFLRSNQTKVNVLNGSGGQACVEVFTSQDGTTDYYLMSQAKQVLVAVQSSPTEVLVLDNKDFKVEGKRVTTTCGINGQPVFIIYVW